MKSVRLAVLFVSACIAGCSAPGPQVRVRESGRPVTGYAENLELAKKKFAEGELAAAASSFRAALREDPNSVAALNGLAATYDRLGRFDLSGPLYVQAMVLAPDSKMVRANYALSLRMRGKTDLADTLDRGGIVADLAPPPPAPLAPEPALAQAAGESMRLASAEGITPPPPGPRLVMHGGTVELVTRFRPIDGPIGVLALSRSLAEDAAPAPTRPVLAQLTIVNGSGRTAAAARLRARLQQRGWANMRLANAPRPVARSRIDYAPWARRHATALAAQLPFATRLVPNRSVAGLRVTIGVGAQPPAAIRSARRAPVPAAGRG